MGNRKQEIEMIDQALEKAFPSASRNKAQTTLANDVSTITQCSKLTAAELRVVHRLIDSFKAVLDETQHSK
jgi:hypothetical protein